MKWGGAYSVAIMPKPKKGGSVSSNTEDIPEGVDTGVWGIEQSTGRLSCWHSQVDMRGGKVTQAIFASYSRAS